VETTSVSVEAAPGLVDGALTAGGALVPAVTAPLLAVSDTETVDASACATTGAAVLAIRTAPVPPVLTVDVPGFGMAPAEAPPDPLLEFAGTRGEFPELLLLLLLLLLLPLGGTAFPLAELPGVVLLLVVSVPPRRLTEASSKVLFLTVSVPAFKMPPAPNVPEFPDKTLLRTVPVPPRVLAMAPPPVADSPEKMQFRTVSLPEFAMPPPATAESPENLELRMVCLPVFATPPPPVAEFPEKVQLLTVSEPVW
jgi:hypothetical protein